MYEHDDGFSIKKFSGGVEQLGDVLSPSPSHLDMIEAASTVMK